MSSGYFGKYRATVVSYDPNSRTCRVKVPGIAEQGDVMPNAEICYPIGDKSVATAGATEIAIAANDLVWVEFEQGDKRFPIIVGYRNPTTGNSTGTRAFSHANIALTAANIMTFSAATLNIAANVNITGNVTTTGTMQNNGKSVGSTHTHSDPQGGTTGTPT